jgi:hypothetical protein
MKKALFYIDSPFQLLQVNEYINKFKIKECKTIIRLNGLRENDKQLLNLVDVLEIENYQIIKMESIGSILLWTCYLIFPFCIAGSVCIGDANAMVFRIYKHIIPNKKLMLFDDGVATLVNEAENETFQRFTMFPEIVKCSVENDFSALKKMIVPERKKNVAVIIGGKLAEEGIISKEYYQSLLSKMVKLLEKEQLEIVYVAHRGESQENLEKISKKWNMEVLRPNYPIELIALEFKVNPVFIVSVLSTALYSMNKIYDEANIYIYQPNYLELKDRKYKIIKLFEAFKEHRIGTIIAD